MPFSDLIGQPSAVEQIRKALRGGTFRGTFLFYGPGGVGEEDLVRATAKALFCKEIQDDFCGTCRTCQRVDRGSYTDLLWMEILPDKSVYLIEQFRDIQDMAYRYPHEGNFRVIVIPEADRMQAVAANSLLKLLEEPSPFTILMLYTSRPRALLPTILSRCRKIRLGPLPGDALVERLVAAGMAPEEARKNAPLLGGRIDNLKEILSGEVIQKRKEFIESVARVGQGGDLEALSFASEFSEREQALLSLEQLAILVRDALLIRNGADAGFLINGFAKDVIEKTFQRMSESDLDGLFNDIALARERLLGNANVSLVMGEVFTRMTASPSAK